MADAFLLGVAKFVADKGLEYWNEEYDAGAKKAFTSKLRAPMVSDAWEIKSQIEGTGPRKFMPIALSEPARRHLKAAALAVRTDFGKSGCFGMVLQSAQGRILALRFEGPEIRGDKHPFYHAQLCNHFRKENLLIECAGLEGEVKRHGEYPDVVPAFPISANSPVNLFYAALVSLFGSGQELLKGDWLTDQKYRSSIGKYALSLSSQAA